MPRPTRNSQRVAADAQAAERVHAMRRVYMELFTGELGANFTERLEQQITIGFMASIGSTYKAWPALQPGVLRRLFDNCTRSVSSWQAAVCMDRVFHQGRYLRELCDSLVRVPPVFAVTIIPCPNESAAVHAAFEQAQKQIERNRALVRVAAFSKSRWLMDGDGAVRVRVARCLV